MSKKKDLESTNKKKAITPLKPFKLIIRNKFDLEEEITPKK